MKKVWNKIKKAATSTWKYFDGKKTTIGTIIYLAGRTLLAFDAIPIKQGELLIDVGMGIATGGLVFKAAKTETAKKITNKAIGKIKVAKLNKK